MAITVKNGKERIAKCSYCDRPFSKLEHAQRHERTHTRDRPFACDQCGKDFARQDTLNRHKRLHERENDPSKPVRGRKRKLSDSKAPNSKPAAPSKSKREKQSSTASKADDMDVDLSDPAVLFNLPASRRLSDSELAATSPAQTHSRRHTIANPPAQTDQSYASLLGLQLDMHANDIAQLERSFTEPSPLEEFLSAASSMSYTEDEDLPSRTQSACSYSGTFETGSGEGKSPSFSSLSPAEELEAILANDPLNARRSNAHLKDFDYHTLAGQIEGASPAPSGVQPHSTLFEDLLGIVAKESEVALRQQPEDVVDNVLPPSTSAAGPAFRTDFTLIGEPAPFLTPQVSTTAELYPLAPPPPHTRRASFTALHNSSSSKSVSIPATKSQSIPSLTMPSQAPSIKIPSHPETFAGSSQITPAQLSPPGSAGSNKSSNGQGSGSPAYYIPTVAEQIASAAPMWQGLISSTNNMDSPSSNNNGFVRV